MVSVSILAFALLTIPNALSISMTSSSTTSLPAPTATPASVLGPVSQLNIGNNYIAPDGYNRSAVLVNGIFPAPLIKANKNDPFAVKIVNELTDNTMPLETSVHWHGLFQHKSNWADGASYVTQCPLHPDEAFTAQFTATDQSGTYWYHSHYSTQYCDGLRGPLVIYDPEDPLASLYDVDDENTVITLSDWYHLSSVELGTIFAQMIPNSTLINGRGRYPGGPSTPLSVINVKPGLRYRFRLINLACDPSFNFTIDSHRMTIIEVDGNEVDPVAVDSIPILVGQRYSVVVTANQSVGNYWIRASTHLSSTFDGGQNLAILRYEGAPDEDPASTAGPYELSFNEGNLHPIVNPGAPGIPEIGKADVNIQLAVAINSSRYFTFNHVSYASPPVPVLLQILSGAQPASQLLPNGSVYVLPLNQTIEISFPNPTRAPGFPHPIHLHGHTFDVVRVSGSNATNFVNPVRRDVVSIGSSATDNVTIRFSTDNPGPWFLHCHINWHLNHGLAAVMAEAPAQAAQELAPVIPADWNQLCTEA
ncbi:laccase [Butyriboletus roseoflavus]|nr:laccase [Butyriboletus roseoflavus]